MPHLKPCLHDEAPAAVKSWQDCSHTIAICEPPDEHWRRPVQVKPLGQSASPTQSTAQSACVSEYCTQSSPEPQSDTVAHGLPSMLEPAVMQLFLEVAQS
jgi:hypothetical protein